MKGQEKYITSNFSYKSLSMSSSSLSSPQGIRSAFVPRVPWSLSFPYRCTMFVGLWYTPLNLNNRKYIEIWFHFHGKKPSQKGFYLVPQIYKPHKLKGKYNETLSFRPKGNMKSGKVYLSPEPIGQLIGQEGKLNSASIWSVISRGSSAGRSILLTNVNSGSCLILQTWKSEKGKKRSDFKKLGFQL